MKVVAHVPSLRIEATGEEVRGWVDLAERDSATWGLTIDEVPGEDGNVWRPASFLARWPEDVDRPIGPDNPALERRFQYTDVLSAAIRVAFEGVPGLSASASAVRDVRTTLLEADDRIDGEAASYVLQTVLWGEVRIS